jgi:CarD family transcriptional regulator
MQFSVGDKVVHPRYGPGLIARIERWEDTDEAKRYYVIEIPGQTLTVYVPVLKVDEAGLRPAVCSSKIPQVLGMLRSQPSPLSEDYKERQEQLGVILRGGQVMQLARMVRDLSWRRKRAHLTQKESDYLRQGQNLLAAEMALVSGDDVADSNKLIGSIMSTALAGVVA